MPTNDAKNALSNIRKDPGFEAYARRREIFESFAFLFAYENLIQKISDFEQSNDLIKNLKEINDDWNAIYNQYIKPHEELEFANQFEQEVQKPTLNISHALLTRCDDYLEPNSINNENIDAFKRHITDIANEPGKLINDSFLNYEKEKEKELTKKTKTSEVSIDNEQPITVKEQAKDQIPNPVVKPGFFGGIKKQIEKISNKWVSSKQGTPPKSESEKKAQIKQSTIIKKPEDILDPTSLSGKKPNPRKHR